jgi:hypothetical protein
MATIVTTPFVITDAILTIGTDDYQSAVEEVLCTPKNNIVTWQPMVPSGAFSAPTAPVWDCKLTYAQDWKTTNSLAQYLLANNGLTKTLVFKPQGSTTGSPIFTLSAIIVPGPIGGKVNTVQLATVTLGVVGVPVKTTAP